MLIDTHSHLHFPAFDEDREEVYQRMVEDDIGTITIGTAISTSRTAISFAQAHDNVWASIGYHPDHVTSSFEDNDLEPDVFEEKYSIDVFEELIKEDKVVAVGEIGLDFSHLDDQWTFESAFKEQKKVFFEQAFLADKYDKPLIVHMRDAGQKGVEVIAELKIMHPNLKIVRHAYTGGMDEMLELLKVGCYFGIGGIVTFKPRKDTLERDRLSNVVKQIPLDKLLLETDAPWLSPVPKRGERNEPDFVKYIAQYVADLKNISFEDLVKETTNNANNVFKLGI